MKVYMSAKVQHLHAHRVQCRMYSTDFKASSGDKWMRDINKNYLMLYKYIFYRYLWFSAGWLRPKKWIAGLFDIFKARQKNENDDKT